MSHDDSALVVERALQLHDEVVAKLFPSTEPVYICTTRLCVLIQVVEWSIERERERERSHWPATWSDDVASHRHTVSPAETAHVIG